MRKINIFVTIAVLTLGLLTSCIEDYTNSGLTSVPREYQYEDAVENGDVVDLYGEISNINKLNDFIENVNKGNEDKVRITKYTIEGDPILYIIKYDGKVIDYIVDNSRDTYGGKDKGISKYKYTKVWKEEIPIELGENRIVDGTSYFLANDKEEKIEVIKIRK